jgi:hypothetical protein
MAKIVLGEENGTITTEEEKTYEIKEQANGERIPDYWKNVIVNSDFFAVNEKDIEILGYLKNVTLKLNENSLDFTVNFHFDKNDYFSEETLFKTYVYDEKTFEPIKANASVVNWKEGKNPSLKIKMKKTKSINLIYFILIILFKLEGKSVETVRSETVVPSFFDIFVAEESGEDKVAELVTQSEFIRDELLANSLELYLDIFQDAHGHENEEEEYEDEPKGKKSNNNNKKNKK